MAGRAFNTHPVTLYSNLIDWLCSLKMRSAPAQQWIATILSAKGIREEEVEYSGLLHYLHEFEGNQKVTKPQLLAMAEEALRFCQLTVRTESLTFYRPELESASFKPEAIPPKVLDSFDDAEIVNCHRLVSFNYRVIRLKFTSLFGSGESWVVFDEHWHRFKPYRNYTTAVEAVDFLYTVAADRFKKFTSRAPINYYERYSLLGKNTRYKEWIVCLPYWQDGFESPHFDLMNVILHLRTSEWTDTRGEPLLLVDELQSDWHAQGRDHGYYAIGSDIDHHESHSVSDAPFKKEWHELAIKMAIWLAIQSGHQRVAFTKANVHKLRYGNDLHGFEILYDQLIPKALAKLASRFQCGLAECSIVVSRPQDQIRYRRDAGWELREIGQQNDLKVIRNKVVALRYVESRGVKRPELIRVFEISPILDDIVKSKGLPLFGWW